MIRVPRPRVVSVRRRQAGQVAIGDVAEARLEPGIIALLESPLGAGYQARYNVPVGLATTAAMAVLAPVSQGVDWTGTGLDIQWSGTPELQDIVLAEARLEKISERLARFSTSARTASGAELYRGTLRMAAIRDGIPVEFGSREEYDAVRASLAATPQDHGPLLRLASVPPSIPLGKTAAIEVELPHGGTVTVDPPFGAGLSFEGPRVQEVPAGARARFLIRADRPHEVNLGKPWALTISASGESVRVAIAVPDPNPGRTFYLLTEDCETFDGGLATGNYAGAEGFGNHNNFMDPEDYRVQMILKPNRMNRIAERHGARWTHFYAATQRFAAEWAARHSTTGQWDRILAEMDEAVRAGSKLHDYCPHIHFDYEPDSALPPQPRLVYDAATDGILPNDYYHPETNPTHRYHDWDGSARGISYIKGLGDWRDLDTKAGSLRKTVQHLARLQANRRAPLVARTGSYDFGKTPEDQAVSTQAYVANGLRGNSDWYRPGSPPAPGGQMFWCAEHDRRQAIVDLREARLVEFGIAMDSGFGSAEEMNRWFAAEREASRGPGMHAILFTTHAMFMAGAPDPFRSLEGGTFDVLDQHLGWVRENHPDVEFATASEAVLEYLDYYTPVLEASTLPLLCGGDPLAGRYEFAVRLLGRGIRVDEVHPATLRIAAPSCFSPEELSELRCRQGGQAIAEATGFDARREPAITVELKSRAPLVLEVVLRPEAIAGALAWFETVYHDPPEAPGADLLRLRPPVIEGHRIRFSSDLVRLLMNPIAGGSEPLGRRVHPLGGFAVGAVLTAALRHGGEPMRMKLRLPHWVEADSDLVAEIQGATVRVRNDSGVLVAKAEVEVRHTEGAPVQPERQAKAPAPHTGPRADLFVAVREWERDFAGALAAYRAQRAWQVMLAFRKAYDLLARGGWKKRAAFLRWMPGLLLGRPSGLGEYDLQFPEPKAYLEKSRDGAEPGA